MIMWETALIFEY